MVETKTHSDAHVRHNLDYLTTQDKTVERYLHLVGTTNLEAQVLVVRRLDVRSNEIIVAIEMIRHRESSINKAIKPIAINVEVSHGLIWQEAWIWYQEVRRYASKGELFRYPCADPVQVSARLQAVCWRGAHTLASLCSQAYLD
jgi:Ni,Fe-hydrogenase III large subunit